MPVTDSGLQTLRRTIEQLPREMTLALRAIAWQSSRRIQHRAREILRSKTRGTGKTAASIVVNEEAEHKQFVVTVDNPENPNLGLWLERGTKHMAARPFMRP